CSYASAPSSYSGTNTAMATWDKAAAFTPSDIASGSKGFTLAQAGSTNKTVHVTDSLGGSLGTVTGTDAAPFASATFQYSHDFAGVGGKCTSYDNTATITETGQSASKKVTVCVGANLTVSKEATPSFTRTYKWGISKSVDNANVFTAGGAPATFNYTVSVTHDSGTDSAWQVNGTITVHKPHNWESATLTGVTDAIANGVTCTVSGNTSQTIAAGGDSTGLTYTCTYASAPSPAAFTNTASATWDKTAASTPDGSASGSASGA